LEVNKNMVDRWERNQKRQPTKKSRKYIRLGILLGVCLVVVFLIFFFMTDLISKPKAALEVKPNPGEWAMYGRDLTHSGIDALSSAVPQGTISKVLTSEAAIHSSPVIAGGILYVGSRDGNMYAIEESSGELLWSYKTRSWVDCCATVANGVVYFGSNDGTFNALNAKTGQKIWSFQGRYPIKSSAAVADGRVYFGGEDYSIYCLDTATGKKIWSKATGGPVSSSPVVAEGILYCGSVDGNLYALNAANGRQRLRVNTIKIVTSSPVVSGNNVYFASSDATVYAVNGQARNWFGEFVLRPPWMVLHLYGDLPAPPPPSGFLWSVLSWGDSTSASPTFYRDHLYIGLGKKVVSINTTAQGKEWETPTDSTISYAGVLSENTVYASGANGHLYLLRADNGQISKDIAVGGPISSNPLMVNGKIYISSEDGCLYQVK
jgi:eukaryotic-like serine/threonine-protein kinase